MSLPFRWSCLPAIVASAGLLAADLASTRPAFAQTPPPASAADEATADGVVPPARVGWLAGLSGSVSFHSANQDQWQAATQNYPMASGDSVWTQPQAQASVMIDASRFTLAGASEFTLQNIDQTTIQAVLSQGEVFINLVDMKPGQSVTITTPRGTVQFAGNGRYDLIAGDATAPTLVSVVTGGLQFSGPGLASPQALGAQQSLTVSGSDPVTASIGPIQQSPFLTAELEQIAPPPPPGAVVPPPVTAEMTGASVLTRYGSWSSEPSVGTVWFPQVASSWVPYRDGHWAYVQPWGWTWVDNAPWGFAPFHYGRWAEFDGRWGWVPAPAGVTYAEPPAYAPALVTFLGVAAGAAVGAAIASGSIGWAPLGLREPYYPPYRVPPRVFAAYNRPFVQNYNQFYQRHVTVVNNHVTYRDVTINRITINQQRGATFVPRAAMLQGRPVAGAFRAPPQNARFETFRPGAPQGLPRPQPGARAEAPHAAAPGPAIHPMRNGAGGRPSLPPLAAHMAGTPAMRPAAARPRAPQPEAHGPGKPIGAQPPPVRSEGRAAPGPQTGRPAESFGQPPHAPAQHGPAPQMPHAPQPRPVPQARPAPAPARAPEAAHQAPHPQHEAPRPVPHAAPAQAQHPAPHAQVPRPAPQAPAPRPAARSPAPRPEPHAAAPHPAPRPPAPQQAPRPPQGHQNVRSPQ